MRLPGDVDGHAARSGEREARDGGDPRIFRIVTAVAVHGSTNPAVGNQQNAACRRLTSGLSRERAARSRDVHPTHYGRICPH